MRLSTRLKEAVAVAKIKTSPQEIAQTHPRPTSAPSERAFTKVEGQAYSTTYGDYRPQHRCSSVAAGASSCAVVEAIDVFISGVGTLDVIPGTRSTNRDGRVAATEALFATRSMRLAQAPAVLGHHHARQLLREPHDRSVACVS